MQTFELEPERLRVAYDGDFHDAPFTVDDVLAGGRRRRRRRTVELTLGGLAAVAAAVVVVVLGAGALSGADKQAVIPAVTTSSPVVARPVTVRSPGCSLDYEKCTADTWNTWADAELHTSVSLLDWVGLSSGLDGTDVVGNAQSAAIANSHALVTLSVGEGVGRYGGLYGDELDDVGEVRQVALPGGGTAEVHSWLDRPERRVVYLVEGNGTTTGDRRLVLTSPRFSATAKGSAPMAPGWSEEAALALLEATE